MRTFGDLALDPFGRWSITNLEPHAAIRLKHMFPRLEKASRGPFEFPASPVNGAELDWFMQRYPLRAPLDVLAGVKQAKSRFDLRQREAERLYAPDYVAPDRPGLRPGKSLRQHQSSAIDLLGLVKGLLVGDDVGEGKTFTAIGALSLPGALPAVIVCDRFLQKQWADRVAEWTDLSVVVINKTTPYSLPPADVRIFAWTQLLGWADYFETMGCGLVAFDEMQELRTGQFTKKGQAADRLAATAAYKLGLTATPIYGYGTEIWNVLRFLRPDVLGDYYDFAREWAPSGKVSDPKALGTYLREQHAMIRKRKTTNRVNRIVQTLPHNAAELKAVEEVARALAITATSGAWSERGEAARELDLRVRMATGKAKAPFVAQAVRAIVEGGEPVVLAGWHRSVYEIWNEQLWDLRPAMFTGSETTAQKHCQKQRFLDGETDVFILSLRSGRGLDGLQARSRVMVFGELDWSGKVHDQVIGRLDREGSICDGGDEQIDAIFLVADDGSDPPIMEVIGLKNSQSTGIVDPDLDAQLVAHDERRLRALFDRYLQRRAA